jgi:hypothetical protein
MELIHHIANATFSSYSNKRNISLENLASKQKTRQIVKEQMPRRARHPDHEPPSAQRDHAKPIEAHRAPDRTRVIARLGGPAGASGGASRDRTGDLLVANQTLSQLSYGPSPILHDAPGGALVGLGGVAPPTSPLSGVRSN